MKAGSMVDGLAGSNWLTHGRDSERDNRGNTDQGQGKSCNEVKKQGNAWSLN